MIKKLLCISISILYSTPLFSMEDNNFDYLKNPQSETCISSYTPEYDAEGYVQMGGYANIQPEFMDRVLSGNHSETLEICAGSGNVLKGILQKQKEAQNSPSIRYTVVECSAAHIGNIQTTYKTFKRADNWLGCAQKNVEDFLTTNLEKKRNKYDQAFAGFALHIFPNSPFLTVVNGLFDVLKEDALLYITQHSFSGSQYDEEYIENVRQGKLLPFWVKGRFWSDPNTMEKLLNAFGFHVIKSGLYQEIHPYSNAQTKYLGIIAQKQTHLYNEEMVSQYRQAANLSFTELDCSNEVNNCKIRLSSEITGSNLWSIHDPKVVDSQYDALKAHTRDIGNDNLLIEKLDIHPNNTSLVRALNAFFFQVANNQSRYKTIFAIAKEGDIVCRILTARFTFEKNETPHNGEIPEGKIQLQASAPGIRKNLIL